MSSSITTDDLAQRIDDPARAPFILDVRANEAFDRWKIEGKTDVPTLNIPYWAAIADMAPVMEQLPAHQEVVVVCAHGGSSAMVAEMMDRTNVHNLEGGMDRWANTLVPRTLMDDDTHFVIQLDRVAKACLSYAVGARGGTMGIIDPSADVERYLAVAEEMDATITDIFDTHLHADHVSVARKLAAHTQATYHIAEGDAFEAKYDYAALQDGEEFTFGEMKMVVRSVATPGHTPGSTSLEVAGKYLMTGDAVFVSGIGRPDLGGETEPWARDLFHTIHDRLAPLDHDLQVCPAHYSSRTEAGDDGAIKRQLGDLLENDAIVSMADEEEFVQYVVEHLGTPPGQYGDIRKVNLGIIEPDDEMLKELEVGRNECALTA
ncbi:MAG: MBL fold metallo-hydrolase [Acidimicrobiia bacterium]|nr:MBL fold metallo-hydrolase [Acidimicrobiia bacterium]